MLSWCPRRTMTKVATPDHGGEQEKADNYKCLKDPGHRCAPVYTPARVPQEDPQREYAKSVDVQSVNVGCLIKSSQFEETDFHWLPHPERCFVRAFVISFRRGRYLVTAEYVRPRPGQAQKCGPGWLAQALDSRLTHLAHRPALGS